MHTGSVLSSDIGDDAVNSSKVADDSLTAGDIAGGFSNGTISLPAGYAAVGRCANGDVSMFGGTPGDVAIFSLKGSVPAGLVITAVGVPSAGKMTISVCNFTGGTSPAISNVPIAAMTVTL